MSEHDDQFSYRNRLVGAYRQLRNMAESTPEPRKTRLLAKAEGVSLALSYYDEEHR